MTRVHTLTASPVDLVTALSLQVGSRYSVRYRSNGPELCEVFESATAPDADTVALPVRSFEDFIVEPTAGLGVYVWTADASGVLVVNEV